MTQVHFRPLPIDAERQQRARAELRAVVASEFA
jgi:hypothetical protein